MPMTHDELQAAIWNDERGLPPGTREVALAMAWVLHREPEHPPGGGFWKRVRELLGNDGRLTRDGHGWRLHDLIAGDAPRYEAGNWHLGSRGCEGPRLRPYKARRPAWMDRCLVSEHHPHVGDCRYPEVYGDISDYAPERDGRDGSVCGSHGTISVAERDMVTGWETDHWFCSRHKDRAREVKAQLAARGEPPEPVPNTGGLLPRYFAADWAVIYARHCERSWTVRMLGWEPPYHGCDADEWPVPGKTLIPRRPRLSVVADAS
jgi:hypothetical protein